MLTMTRAPRMAWYTRPRPPKRLVPPITAAAIASSRRVPPPVPTETEKSREALTTPAVAANITVVGRHLYAIGGNAEADRIEVTSDDRASRHPSEDDCQAEKDDEEIGDPKVGIEIADQGEESPTDEP